MSIRVGKYNYKTKVQPTTNNHENILIHTTGHLSPYTIKDTDGVIMESFWQFSKVWKDVEAQAQTLSRFQQDQMRWKHPAENHITGDVEDGKKVILTPEYWKWRKKGLTHNKWVRYPAGFHNHSKAVCSIVGTPDDYKQFGYIEARKKIYFAKYREIAIKTNQFKELQKKVNNGEKIQINEVDGPKYDSEYPYNLVKDGSLEMTEDILVALINNPRQAFGHGYALAACLLDIDLTKK